MPHVERIGVDRADLGNAVFDLARRTKPLGDEPHPVFVDDELDIVPDRLGRDRVVGIVGHGIVLRCGGRRGQVVDDCDQLLRLDFGDAQVERLQHRNKAVAGLLEIFVADRLGRRHTGRNDDLMVPGVEGRILRARFPDESVEPTRTVTGNRLVNAALDVARRKPGCDDPADARGCEMQDLETGACRKPFGEERPEDLAGAFVCPDQGGDRKHEAFRTCVEIEPARRIVDPVWEPVRQQIEHQGRPVMLGVLGIAEKPGKEPVDNRLEFLGHHLGSFCAFAAFLAASIASMVG